MRNQIVVLGAAGFVGYHLAERLSKDPENRLILVDNFIRSENDFHFQELISKKNCSFYEMDLTSRKHLEEIINEGDIVYNLVALNGTRNFYEQPMTVMINTGMTAIAIAEICGLKKASKYFYFGSSESYAGSVELGLAPIPTPEKIPLAITDISNVRWSYGASKTLGEIACFAAHKEFGLEFTVFRIHNLYGPRMGFDHVVSDLIKKFSSSNTEVFGLEETRSFMFIADAIDAILSIAELSENKERVVNIGSEQEVTIRTLAQIILDKINPKLEIKDMGRLEGSVIRRSPDVSLLKTYYSSTPISLLDGVEQTIEYYRNN
jgi:UDP-glucose 4-epimerase